MKAVILAGGRGARLGCLTDKMPKPLVPICGVALIEWQLKLFKRYGVGEVFILSGYLAGELELALGGGGEYGLKIRHVVEKEPLGTAGALKQLDGVLRDDFFVVYGDIMFDMDLRRLLDFHRAKKSRCTPVLHPNDHPFDSDLADTDREGRVTAMHAKPHPGGQWLKNLANTGVYVFSPEVLRLIPAGQKKDFAGDILPALLNKLPVYGYVTPEYLKDAGTPERLEKVEKDLLSGRIAAFNLRNKRRAVFLDRDGVLNANRDHVGRLEDFELLPGAAAAVRKINSLGLLAVVVTNQPAVARNLCSLDGLETIHRKMETLLGREGAYLDAIYYCPHHPDKGFPEENPAYKIECGCRKPKTGMITRARADLNIRLEGSYLVGDAARDIECGRRAGLTAILVGDGRGKAAGADFEFEDLTAAAEFIAKREAQ
ncbi:MAG: HAD-IIIA family hydrolase [Elusimicrobiales bacterium]|nr:HAD-IIIA family hydrolase [Elusimicrobiales bacterium]